MVPFEGVGYGKGDVKLGQLWYLLRESVIESQVFLHLQLELMSTIRACNLYCYAVSSAKMRPGTLKCTQACVDVVLPTLFDNVQLCGPYAGY